jgi:hypothetical protein
MTEVVTAASQAAGGEADRSYVYRCDPGPAGSPSRLSGPTSAKETVMSKGLKPGAVLPDFTLPTTPERCGGCRSFKATTP